MKSYPSSSDIKVGVVGYGGAFNMGKKHLQELQDQGMVPVAVAEMDAERLKVATEDFPGIGTYASIDEMLAKSDVDLIVLITPHNTHAELALKALRAGRHVVCEKPLAITTAECDEMIAAAAESGVMLSTYHNRHWDGIPLTALKLIAEGELGDIYKIQCRMGHRHKPRDWWRTSRTISGGVLYDWGVHLLEYSLQIIESEITEVSGFAYNGFWGNQTRWGDDANEDEAAAVIRFANGARVELSVTHLDSDSPDGMMRVVGTKGSVTFMDPHSRYRLCKQEGKERCIQEGAQEETKQELYYQNVAEFLTGKADLIITPEWSRRPIHILDLAAQSAKLGKTLPAVYQ
ncbi:Gfo/Idh/MocA family protein [Cerasicoccus frondis]|uniref:Gfo/Idh/MocA family protein n=1 Tax=Cerasicoccus frondis TaxID=490090 RepID=UPI0028524AF8|nr:Gfo/Idh/MocA family oxidoreductase [Cerasicoccus frondis]